MKKISILFFALTLGIVAKAQDIHFSQFYMAPLNLNPAMTGVMNCSQRISGNYRNQWASVLRDKAFQTYQVAYDSKIPVGRYDYIGVGGTLWGDKAGSLNYHTNQLSLDFSYAKKMGGYRKKASYLVMGAELGLTNKGLNTLDARWGSQNNGGVFDPTLPSNETIFTRDNYMYADVLRVCSGFRYSTKIPISLLAVLMITSIALINRLRKINLCLCFLNLRFMRVVKSA